MAGLVVSWGRRAKLLSITPENSVDDAYRLKRATWSVPQLRHLLLLILFGANYCKFQVIFLLIFPTADSLIQVGLLELQREGSMGFKTVTHLTISSPQHRGLYILESQLVFIKMEKTRKTFTHDD